MPIQKFYLCHLAGIVIVGNSGYQIIRVLLLVQRVENLNLDAKTRDAAERVLELLNELGVAYDRELRYRLEGEFPHDTTGKAIEMLKREGRIKPTNLPGRKGGGSAPNVFYRLPESNYNELIPIMKKKLDLSIFVSGVTKDMGMYAQILWKTAFIKNGWKVYPEGEGTTGCREWKGRTATVGNDLDFIAIKDDMEYGIEVKNGLSYPTDLFWKVHVAMDLEVVPIIVARWLNPRQIRLLKDIGCPRVIYKEAIFTDTYAEIVEKLQTVLGYPVGARAEIDDDYFEKKLNPIHKKVSNDPYFFKRLKANWDYYKNKKDFQTGLGNKKRS